MLVSALAVLLMMSSYYHDTTSNSLPLLCDIGLAILSEV